MKRRHVLKTLTGTGANLFPPSLFKSRSTQKTKSIMLIDTAVAGFQHYKGNEVWGRLKTGDNLRLAREPRNPFDYDAVEIYRGRDKIGYIPRTHTAAIAQMLDRGMILTSKINRLNQSDNPKERVGIAVEMVV